MECYLTGRHTERMGLPRRALGGRNREAHNPA